MKKNMLSSTLIGLLLVLALAGAVYAQGPVPQHSDPYWYAAYWNNLSFSGNPALERTEERLDWDWGNGSPHPNVHADHFTARWTRYLDVPAGTYRFTATSDDGIRVYVDGRAIIDQWYDQAARTHTGDVRLDSGHHWVIVEYYENGGAAVARVSWAPVSGTPEGWRGEYYANRTLAGSPALVRDDRAIDFDWGSGSPAAGLPSDTFSVRWTRTLRLEGGSYRFTTTTDDGVRLWVVGHLLIDQWRLQSAKSHSDTIYVEGDVPVVMEYFEEGGVAVARLRWERVDGTPSPTPDQVIVDDTDPGFTKGGAPSAWRTQAGGYGGSMTWTLNNDQYRPNYNWARWYPDLESGQYEVYVYIPEDSATTRGARYWIAHAGGFSLRVVNQAENRGQWVSLGTYRFRGTDSDYVSLADITYESYLSQRIGYDAAKWVPRTGLALKGEITNDPGVVNWLHLPGIEGGPEDTPVQ
jgi:hypothetical protein